MRSVPLLWTRNTSDTENKAYNGEMVFSTIKCRIELGTLFSLLCNLVCVNAFATLKMCVCIGSKYLQKIREKSLQNRAKRDFCNVFREFFANIEILYTHIWSVAKAWTHTKLHSSKNKVPSEILHLIVDDSFCHFSLVWNRCNSTYINIGVRVAERSKASDY